MRKFNSAPLPFMGQKRNFLKHFSLVLQDYPEDALYVDLFGGSGLLSHTVKQVLPKAKVVYNDYDNYMERIKNISKTNLILSDFREILKDYPKDKKIVEPYRSKILERLKYENTNGYVDWITISSSILFSMKYYFTYEDFCSATLYNTLRTSYYDAKGYLKGVDIVRNDYKLIFDKYKNEKNVIFLVDPPYLSTDVSAYKSYWKLSDYLDVLNVLKKNRYFYFTSNKSSIVELCNWIQINTGGFNPFDGSTVISTKTTVNYNSSYTDIMLFK